MAQTLTKSACSYTRFFLISLRTHEKWKFTFPLFPTSVWVQNNFIKLAYYPGEDYRDCDAKSVIMNRQQCEQRTGSKGFIYEFSKKYARK